MDMWSCKFCKKEIELKSSRTKSGHLANCKVLKEYKNTILTKDYLKEEYVKNKRSALEIAQEHGLESASLIIKLMKKYGMKTRNIKESKNSREKEKRRKTNIEKYGVEHNFSNGHPSREKYKKLLAEEGITTIFQRHEVIEKITEIKYEKGYMIPRKYKTDELEKYYSDVWYLTNKNYKNFYYDINPDNMKRGMHDYHLDHKVSILYGYLNNIPVDVISHKCNLEMLYYTDNLSKGPKCSLTIEELNERIKEVSELI